MIITKHAIKRFQERITFETSEIIRSFIESEIINSVHLYKINNIEKRIEDGIVYVLDWKNENRPTVVTLYIQGKEEALNC